jgi:hypothetical protein
MSELFILQNQHKLFLGKQNAWVDGQDPNVLYKTPYKDEAINQMVEVSAKDYTQRIRIVPCNPDEKGLPDIDPAILPELQPTAVDLFAGADEDAMEKEDSDVENREPFEAITENSQG